MIHMQKQRPIRATGWRLARHALFTFNNRRLSQHLAPEKRTSLAHLHQTITRMRLPSGQMRLPGWLTPREQQTLYALAYLLPGPILEIGSWLGRSTACLASGIRDSTQAKTLVAVDLKLKPEYFRPYADKIGFFYPSTSDLPLAVVDKEDFTRNVEPIIRAPGGSRQVLRENLTNLDLIDLVHVVICDFRDAPVLPYRLVFCDVTHDPIEIERNIPDMAHLLAPGTILACHDIDATNEKCLHKLLPFRYSFMRDSLFVGEL
ncbi:class I SAM-dependent methyltransferase [Candidatus Viridilinea mediisalina]|uniref:Methyltransferase n=1 Tax=Candidatus Viridilinea mediisalina TaxID=2024553 RepID=A0A2A6RLF0_9CHLR|nr:class I SAM-dependent methyltransferase [Candidatus Viridilinea mediisalina]PDW03897.1 hypothetical protein CJ255_06500 [Candidatus Viridilinea mediisalina]